MSHEVSSRRNNTTMGKVHGSLACAGKVRGQTPKVAKQGKKKKPLGRVHKRMQYNRCFVTAVFWTSVMRKLKKYLTCCKLAEPRAKEKYKGKMRMNSCYLSEKKTSRGDGGKLPKKNCNYYSEMNEEERNEKLMSAIRYCKDSKCRVSEPSVAVLGTRVLRDRRSCVRVKKLWDDPDQEERIVNLNLDGYGLHELKKASIEF
ncbi:unnamed protein product [Camellia sinensis]